jgi:hypothetical protein
MDLSKSASTANAPRKNFMLDGLRSCSGAGLRLRTRRADGSLMLTFASAPDWLQRFAPRFRCCGEALEIVSN